MIRARIFTKNADGESLLKETFLTERPALGTELEGGYKVLSISSSVPMGTNISAGEPEMGIKIIVTDI